MTSASIEPMVITFHFTGQDMAPAIRSVCASIPDKEVSWVNASKGGTDMEIIVHSVPALVRQVLQAAAERANCSLIESDDDYDFTVVSCGSKNSSAKASLEGGAFVLLPRQGSTLANSQAALEAIAV